MTVERFRVAPDRCLYLGGMSKEWSRAMNMNHAEVDFEIDRLRGVCASYRAEIELGVQARRTFRREAKPEGAGSYLCAPLIYKGR